MFDNFIVHSGKIYRNKKSDDFRFLHTFKGVSFPLEAMTNDDSEIKVKK